MKEIYTDLEKPGINSKTFTIKLDDNWFKQNRNITLILGEDFNLLPDEPEIEKGIFTYKIKLTDIGQKKIFG